MICEMIGIGNLVWRYFKQFTSCSLKQPQNISFKFKGGLAWEERRNHNTRRNYIFFYIKLSLWQCLSRIDSSHVNWKSLNSSAIYTPINFKHMTLPLLLPFLSTHWGHIKGFNVSMHVSFLPKHLSIKENINQYP